MEAARPRTGSCRPTEIEIRPHEFVALAGGKPLELTVRELELLTALVERSGRIVSREELYRVVWGESYRKADRSVDVYVGQAAPQARPRRCPSGASSTPTSASATASRRTATTA